jgi:hypothetical protein
MAAYVASARIDGGRPRVVAPVRRQVAPSPTGGFTGVSLPSEDSILDTSPPGQRDLELRWDGVKERWSQLWFFVLDSESWR